MRVVFLGTPEFAVPSLKALLRASENRYRVVGVITQPDRPAGRGQKITSPPVKRIAREAGLLVYQPHRIRDNPDALAFLRAKNPELAVVVAYGQILPKEFFDFPPLGTVNVHASLLPKYRGPAPVVHALLNGEQETGVSVMKIDEGMDTGDILSQARAAVGENMTAGELSGVLSQEGAKLLLETIARYAGGELEPQRQNDAEATYAPFIEKEEARIDWTQAASHLHNRIRAFNPRPVAFAEFRDQRVKIWRSEKVEKHDHENRPASEKAGQVAAAGQEGILIQCGEKTFLRLKELQLPNRKKTSARDFVNGVNLRVGEVFR